MNTQLTVQDCVITLIVGKGATVVLRVKSKEEVESWEKELENVIKTHSVGRKLVFREGQEGIYK